MLEFYRKDTNLFIKNSDNKVVQINLSNEQITLDDFLIDSPWEYEKAWILLEVKEYEGKLFYSFSIENKHIVVIFYDNFELKEEILSFFWDVDILLIKWSKESSKIQESIEAKLVIPFWEAKDIFLNTLGQHKEEEQVFKLKWDLSSDTTEFVNLA